MENQIFSVYYADDDTRGVAYAEPGWNIMRSGVCVESWVPIVLQLKHGKFADYLANNMGVRLCSTEMRNVINENRTSNDKIQWLDVNVTDCEGGPKGYWILHFPRNYPIVNERNSSFSGKRLVQAVIDSASARKYRIFTLPGTFGPTMFVSNDMKCALEQAYLTGIAFDAATVA